MANTFKRFVERSIGTSLTAVGSYSVSSGTQVTVIGLTISNTSSASVDVDASLYDGANDTYIVKTAPVPAGGTLVIVGGEQKVVLEPGDGVRVKSSASGSCDSVLSLLEIS